MSKSDNKPTQDDINKAAGTAHWNAYQSAIAAGKSKAEAMKLANEAQRAAGGAM